MRAGSRPTCARWPLPRRACAVETIGKTEEGREILLVAVADEDGSGT
jgi:hypothetical protein